MQALDSAYESVSATGVTVPTVPSASTRPGTELYQIVHGNTFPAASSVPLPSGDAMIPDKEKRESIVRKLEKIFENDLGAFGESNEATKSLKNVQHRPLVASTAPVVNETSARPLDESLSSGCENIESAGAQPDHRLQPGNLLPQQNEANQNKRRPSPSHLRCPGVASPTTEPGPQASPGWIYLNLLVNMAQLHTLNVTPDFVRKAIYDCSTKLMLSDDGGKVRWRGYSQQTGPSPDEPYKSAATPLANSPVSSSVKKLEQDGRGPSITGRDSAQEYSTSYLQDTTSSGRHQSSILNNADSTLQYRPMFAPRKRQSSRSHHDAKDEGSVDSDSTSSSMASCPAQTKMDIQSGPMIFLDRDPFFLDLSADFPDSDRLDHKLYGRLVEQPLGRQNRSTEMYRETEKRSSNALPTVSGEILRHGNSLHESISFPSLTIYDDDDPANPAEDSTTGAEPVELAASGMGGIQLDDNFAINVKTEQQPPPPSLSVRPYEDGRESQTRPRVSGHMLPTHPPVPAARHRHLLSATTTHLPPSPLPPPSYAYPAFSSSSSSSDCESDDDILDDVDSDSELAFRPLSLSPQMRMFLEGGGEEASAPEDEEEDEDMDVEEEED